MTSSTSGPGINFGRRDYTALLGDLTAATLVLERGAADLRIRREAAAERLFTARFTGRQPAVSADRGRVSVRYRRGTHRRTSGDIALSPDVSWAIHIEGGTNGLDADLTQIGVTSIDIDGGATWVTLRLSTPGNERVPIRIAGGASRVVVVRPAGVATRLHVGRGVADLAFDNKRFGAIGSDIRLDSPGDDGAGGYDIDISSGASHLTVATT